ncbi:MAG: transcription-repair coupling factor, partial [Clostridia bacterium]|nr:transcription-repair coupling factor [Clostridia bacterium]
MNFLTNVVSELKEYKTLLRSVSNKRLSAASGLTGVHKANVMAALCRQLDKKALVLTGDEQESKQLSDDMTAMGLRVLTYPLRDLNFRDVSGQSREYEHQRLMALSSILKGDFDAVVACVDAAAQFTMPPEILKTSSFRLKVGEEVQPAKLTAVLEASGYERCEQVEGEGQYAVRGGILDLFMPDEKAPIRIEFWGDEIDTINYFDVITQRRTDYIEEINVSPSTELLIVNKNNLIRKIQKKSSSLRSKGAAKAKEILMSECEKLEQGIVPQNADKFISLIYPRLTSL